MTESTKVNRRGFLGTTGAAAGALAAAGAFPHPAVGNVKGANERLNFAMIGCGGRMQAHLKVLLDMKEEGKLVDIVAVADVYEKNRENAKNRTNAKDAYVDYRKIIDDKNIDAVAIGTPDHWHARQTIDALKAGKDVYCEKPMTHTVDEAREVAETVEKTGQVMCVGVQSMADPRWGMAHDLITEGKIGKIMQAQTSYYRNSSMGQWRYYALSEDMTPNTVDWKMFLGTDFGLAPDMPFNRAKFAQWRCYWEFGGGMYTDLFVHQLSHLIRAVGVRLPRRVVGAGGLYMEYDGRDVPDVALVAADYDEGCQVLVMATMCNDTQIDELIRGHTGTIKFERDGFRIVPQEISGRPAPPGTNKAEGGEHISANPPRDDTRALWDHFIGCIRSRNPETLSPASLGYAAIATVNLGVDSYREGTVKFLDPKTGQILNGHEGSVGKDWAANWEKMSKERAKPRQVMGWKAGDEGSLLEPLPYQKLEGDWIDGKDPASA